MEVNLNSVLKEIEGNRYFKVVERGDFVKVSYRYNAPKVFDSPLKRELRGITFRKSTGEVVSRPFHKFFNVNENEETQRERLSNREFIAREKFDGTMVHFFLDGEKIAVATQKSFDAPQLERVREIVNGDDKLSSFIKSVLSKDCTPIFEFVSPEYQIVIPYDKERLILTEIRDNRTGKYLLERYEHQVDVDVAGKVGKGTLKDFERMLENREFIEGFVLKNFDREEPFPLFVKLKSPWYYDRHYAFTYLHNIPVHKLFLLYLQGKWDDFFSRVTNEKLKERRLKELEELISAYERALKVVEKAENEGEIRGSEGFPVEVLVQAYKLRKKGKNYEKFLGQKFYEYLKKNSNKT